MNFSGARDNRDVAGCPQSDRMGVTVVEIRVVGVPVRHWSVPVHVDVRFSGRIVRFVFMVMMLVMHVDVLMEQVFVRVFVLMMLGEVEP